MNPFSLCGNQIHDEIHSADAELRAVIFQRDCGATTGFATQISILGEDERLPNRGGDVLVIDGHPRNVAPRIEWFGSDTLLVHRALDGSEYKAEESWGHSGRIEIVYDEN